MTRLFHSSVWLAGLFCLCVAGTVSAQSLIARYVAGNDYIEAAQPAAPADDGKIHVTEFFLYTCPHCYHFESELEGWQKKLGDDVVLDRVPVLFGPDGETYARLYYTEVDLGVVDRLHDKIFDAIHRNGNPLATRAAIRAFMVDHDVDGKAFDKTFDSEQVNRQVAEIVPAMRRFRVVAVPSMSVAGRYWVSGQMAGSNNKMLEVVDYLINTTAASQNKTADQPR